MKFFGKPPGGTSRLAPRNPHLSIAWEEDPEGTAERIANLLRNYGGNVRDVAEALRVSRWTLYRWINDYPQLRIAILQGRHEAREERRARGR
jgi:transposase